MREPKLRLWIPGYTTIEANMVQEKGAHGLELAVRKDTGSNVERIQERLNFVSGAIAGLTTTRYPSSKFLHSM